MSNKWRRIDQEQPKEYQHVFYWFEVFGMVYRGQFCTTKRGKVVLDQFYNNEGFLSNDVTFWMPVEDSVDLPEPPSEAERRTCKYHPLV